MLYGACEMVELSLENSDVDQISATILDTIHIGSALS